MSNAFAPIVRARPLPHLLADLFIVGVAPLITARYFSSDSSDSGSLRTPCPPPACTDGRQGITPAFGYSAPHPSAGGTLTPLTHALPSTHYEAATTSRSRNLGRLLVRFRAPRDPSSVRARHMALPIRWRTDPGLGTCSADCPRCRLALTWT